jgi:hypothetical protein
MYSLATSQHAEVGPVRVVNVPGNGYAADAVIAPDGTAHIVYVDSTDLYYTSSRDGGQSFSAPLRVNSQEGNVLGGRFRGPDIDLGADGILHVIWYNLAYQLGLPQDQWGVIYARIDPATEKVSGERHLNARPSDNYSVAAHKSGTVAAVWTAEGLFLQLSRDNGLTFSDPVQVLPGEADPCECCATKVMFGEDGTLYVIYRDKAENIRDMHLLTWTGAISGGEPEFLNKLLSVESWKIDLCPMTGSSLAATPTGGVLAAWETRTRNRFASLDNTGSEFTLAPVLAVEKGNYPLVLTNPAGQILVAWKWRNELSWKLYHEAGDSDPENGTFTARTDDRPGGVTLPDGTFLLLP